MASKTKVPLAVPLAPHVRDAVYVGLDQSLTGTGVCVFDGEGKLLGNTLISTKPGNAPLDEVARFTTLWSKFYEFVNSISAGRMVCVVMEDFAFSQAHQMAALGGLGWFFRIMLSRTPWHFATCSTGTLKTVATGKGSSPKEMIILGVYKRWTFEASDNNVADAYVLGKLSWVAYAKPLPCSATGVTKGDLEAAQKLTLYR